MGAPRRRFISPRPTRSRRAPSPGISPIRARCSGSSRDERSCGRPGASRQHRHRRARAGLYMKHRSPSWRGTAGDGQSELRDLRQGGRHHRRRPNFGMARRRAGGDALRELGVACVLARSFAGSSIATPSIWALGDELCRHRPHRRRRPDRGRRRARRGCRLGLGMRLHCDPLPPHLLEMIADGGLVRTSSAGSPATGQA